MFYIKAEAAADEKPFLKYFEKTWIGEKKRGGTRKAPLFSLDMWSVHQRAHEKSWLTTNNAELFHRHHRTNLASGAVHPPFLTFMESLHNQQTLTNNDMAKFALGHSKQEKPCTLRRTECLSKLVDDYLVSGEGLPLLDGVAKLYMAEQ